MKEDVKAKIRACKDMIKGRTAEAIVEELFRVLGYEPVLIFVYEA